MQGIHDDSTLARLDRSSNVVLGSYKDILVDTRTLMEDQGSFVIVTLAAISVVDGDILNRSAANMLCGIVQGITTNSLGVMKQRTW